jgi:hypothetical protein
MTAAQHALAEGDFEIAAKRLIYARERDPADTTSSGCWRSPSGQAGTSRPRGRSVRVLGARPDRQRPAPHRFAVADLRGT